ncbi:hypothetical protein JD77_04210 [Micromonospora olivasterospora]|uniref:Uncharacterized protein n=1 Tax=Micromonospora olivasterospora TaxID=1880 RepID=A0A562IE80_MICOL|nr:hypothetical protein JD77_04210 [Micromonospora olivasterospora]
MIGHPDRGVGRVRALPAVPSDTTLSLRAGEWATGGNVVGVTQVDVRTVRVGGSPEGVAGWVWVRGHNLECRWPWVACAREWCVRVAVRAEALYDALAR